VIRFFVDEGGSVLRDKRHVRAWLQEVLFRSGVSKANINYIFCGDAYLHRLNVEFLDHDTYTDIITFPGVFDNIIQKETLAGECYISTERVLDNAQSLGIPYSEELHRVMVHGLLHLLGQGDKSEEEAVMMRRKENDSLLMRKFHVEQSMGGGGGKVLSAVEIDQVAVRGKRQIKSQGINKFHVEQSMGAGGGGKVLSAAEIDEVEVRGKRQMKGKRKMKSQGIDGG
jgi:probable rRNA maturation factor